MDLLKRELRKKRRTVREDFAGKSFVRRSELEQKQLQKRRRDEHPKASALAFSLEPRAASDLSSNPYAVAGNLNPSSSDELSLPRHEVIRSLRVLREPVTLFGEDDAARVKRLKLALKSSVIDDLDMTRGQTNDFLGDTIETRKRHKSGRNAYAKRVGGGAGGAAGDYSEDDGNCRRTGDDDGDADRDSKRMKAMFDELCKEDKILVFFKRLLNEWKQELDGMTELEKRTANGKTEVARFNQCAKYLGTLFEFCRKKILPDDVRQALLDIADCCMRHDYLLAMQRYIKLANGNRPWPIGVTMVGIHERSAREKICTNSIATS